MKRSAYKETNPSAAHALLAFEGHIRKSGLDDAARAEFGDAPLVDLTLAVATINAWNRLNIAFRTPAGTYQAKAR